MHVKANIFLKDMFEILISVSFSRQLHRPIPGALRIGKRPQPNKQEVVHEIFIETEN